MVIACFSKRRKLYLYTDNTRAPQRGIKWQIFKWQKSVRLRGSLFAQPRLHFPPVWAPMDNRVWKSHVKLCFTAVSSRDMRLCPCVGSERMTQLTNKNASQKNLDKIAERDLMQEREQALKGQHDDRLFFTLLTVLQLLAAAGRHWRQDKSQ